MIDPYIQYMYSYPHKTAYGRLYGVSLADHAGVLAAQGSDLGLYLHLPFCQTKCGYCDLFSVVGQGTADVDRYLDAVERQLLQYSEALKLEKAAFADFTMGGGTPLFLEERQLERVFAMVEGGIRFRPDRTIVVETAPNQTTREKLDLLRAARVTRVSMGIQSFSDRELQVLWRQHSAGRAREALELLKGYDFPCVNLDFIYGIPGQTVESFLRTLKEAVAYDPEELFIYPLYVKHGAGLERKLKEGMVLDPQGAYRQYQEARGFLCSEGFRQDSMRRFVRRGGRQAGECGASASLALGCGGRSYVGDLHFCAPYAITQADCLGQIRRFEETADHTAVTHGIFLTEEEARRRYVIRHLFIRPGLSLEQYRRRFSGGVLEDLPVLRIWLEKGLVREQGAFLTMTEEGMGLSDYLGPQLISRDVRARMARWEAEHGYEGYERYDGYDPVQGQSEKL